MGPPGEGSAPTTPLRFLVTGASGFIGSHVVRELNAAGHRVFPMVRNPDAASALAPHAEAIRRGDLRDQGALEEAVAGVDIIVHLGGLTRARSEAEFMDTNAEGVARLVRAAVKRSPNLQRFILVSSLSAGGPSDGAAARQEHEPPRPVSAYGRSKLAGEERLRAEAGGMPWTILRPPIVYGPGERDLHTMFRYVKRGWVPLVGFEDRAYSIVHARDVAHAILAISTTPASAGQVYYVAEPRVYRGRELVSHIAAALGTRARVVPVPEWIARLIGAAGSGLKPLLKRPPLVTLDKLPEMVRSWVCSPDKLLRDCGFQCRVSFPEGAAETAAWYRTEGWI